MSLSNFTDEELIRHALSIDDDIVQELASRLADTLDQRLAVAEAIQALTDAVDPILENDYA